MKNGDLVALIIISVLLVSAVTPVFADEIGAQANIPKPVIKTLHIVGKGIAVSQTDLSDFKIITIGIARVIARIGNESSELMVGLLFLDKDRYRLKNVEAGNGTFSADVYRNDTDVGSINANLIEREGKDVWIGELTIDDKTYNIYVFEPHRKMNKFEIRDKVSNYCRAHHEEANCSGKIDEYCENNPTDQRCIALLKNFCKNNLDDVRCRAEIKDYCNNNPEAEICQTAKLRLTERYCTKHPLDKYCLQLQKKRIVEYCIDHPNDKRCVAAQKGMEIMNRIRERLRTAEFCRNNPTDEKCVEFCENHPIACGMNKQPPLTTPGEVNESGEVV